MNKQRIRTRVDELYDERFLAAQTKNDNVFFWLLLAQWAFAIVLALVLSPYAWEGKTRTVHFHVAVAVIVGGVINALPLLLIKLRPGWWGTRQTVAVAQMLWSALLIHLSGGRIETHFHVFGSLAFLAFYRDWRVLPTATLVVAADHLARGMLWPESVYGIANPEWWRFLEHAGWVAFEDVVLVLGCVRGTAELRLVAQREAELEVINAKIEEQVHHRTRELNTSLERFRSLVENTKAVPFELDAPTRSLTYVAPQAEHRFGHTVEALLVPGQFLKCVHSYDRVHVVEVIDSVSQIRDDDIGVEADLDFRLVTSANEVRDIHAIIQRSDGRTSTLRGIAIDVTSMKRLESELRQAQKLESVGRLAAGVAHEINTPVQFVSDSLHFVQDAMKDMMEVLRKLQVVRQSVLEGHPGHDAALVAARAEEESDLPYVFEHLPKALDRAVDGLGRVTTIVQSMKDFAHPDRADMNAADLNHAIRSTLTVARSEYKYIADVDLDLEDLPPVVCHVSEVNQVVLNLIVNAAHAVGDATRGTDQRGTISIKTRRDGDDVVISVGDTGVGIPEDIRHRIFDPFFTTKDVGRGTGQGLAIARSVIVEKHAGALTFESEVGRGTVFTIRLPIAGASLALQGAAA